VALTPSVNLCPNCPLGFPAPVFIDKVCTLDQMARVFVELANDAPPPAAKKTLEKLMEIENCIAEGIFKVEDRWALEQMSVRSGLNCKT